VHEVSFCNIATNECNPLIENGVVMYYSDRHQTAYFKATKGLHPPYRAAVSHCSVFQWNWRLSLVVLLLSDQSAQRRSVNNSRSSVCSSAAELRCCKFAPVPYVVL
jgi:hypothetical protein